MLGGLFVNPDHRVLVDYRTSDDAGVYRLENGTALVQTVDFFTPIVDDPHVYGQIAAANALSDVYAMGGRPLTALAIAGFPKEIDRAIVRSIFTGGLEMLRRAGVALLGGHTVQDTEIKFGYAVTGTVDPADMWTNAGARAGDALVLTKPLGTGVVATALKFDRAPEAMSRLAVESMLTLNSAATEALRTLGPGAVHACTDITGFGLVGHASEMAAASGVTLRIDAAAVPLLDGVRAIASDNMPGGSRTNAEHFAAGVRFEGELAPDLVQLLHDPQTSGGLLVAVGQDMTDEVLRRLAAAGAGAWRIGGVVPSQGAALLIR